MEQEKTTLASAEDKVMKVAMQAFGENIMKYLGQTDRVKRVAPTEHIHLEESSCMKILIMKCRKATGGITNLRVTGLP